MGVIPDDVEMTWLLTYTGAAVSCTILTIIHSVHVYSDFFTVERKSINHRSTKPNITADYKFMQYLTLLVLVFYALCAIFFSLEMFTYTWSVQTCVDINNVGGWFLVVGKGLMYCLFMYRLNIFEKSAFGYSKRLIRIIAWTNVAFGVIAEGVTTYMMAKYWNWFADDDGFPNPCFPIIDGWHVSYFAVMMLTWDLIMNVLSLYLFVNPLRKAVKFADCDKDASTITKRMLYIAIKYTMMTSVASLTTSFVYINVLYIFPTTYYIVSWDVVINSICIMLMTAYYPDERYYERICFCCLSVFVPRKLRGKQLRAEKELTSQLRASTGTDDRAAPAVDQSVPTGTSTNPQTRDRNESEMTSEI